MPRLLCAREAPAMSEVFADAFYYIALLNPKDQFHAAALQATRMINRPLVTTVRALIEVADALSAPAVRERSHRLLDRIIADRNTTVVMDVVPWLGRGLQLFGRRADKDWSLTDCISFEVMADRG